MNGQLPAWLANWLGVTVPSNADTATWQLDSRWSWAPWATLLLVLIAIAWTVSMYARESGNASRIYRAGLVGLRLAAIGLVLVMLAQWALALWLTGPPSIAMCHMSRNVSGSLGPGRVSSGRERGSAMPGGRREIVAATLPQTAHRLAAAK